MIQDMLDLYTDYLISQNKYATATGLAALLDNQISHDKITRFLNKNNFNSQDLWKYVKSNVRQFQEEKGGVLILDDSIEEKPYTDESDIICWHFSHAKGRCIKGVNLLSSLVRYGDIAFPVCYDVITKDISFCDVETQKEKRRSSVSKNVLFRNQIKQAIKNNIAFDYVLADSWFGSKENLKTIHFEFKKMFIIGIKKNRLISLSNEERKKGQYQNLKTLNLKNSEKIKVWLKELPFPVVIIKKIFKNGDGSTGELYLVTNDLDTDVDRIYEIYQKRWRIEEYHKSIKQNASLEKSPTKIKKSQKNHIFASIISYCKLEFLSLKTNLNHFALKYKLILKANQMAFQELQKLRGNILCA